MEQKQLERQLNRKYLTRKEIKMDFKLKRVPKERRIIAVENADRWDVCNVCNSEVNLKAIRFGRSNIHGSSNTHSICLCGGCRKSLKSKL